MTSRVTQWLCSLTTHAPTLGKQTNQPSHMIRAHDKGQYTNEYEYVHLDVCACACAYMSNRCSWFCLSVSAYACVRVRVYVCAYVRVCVCARRWIMPGRYYAVDYISTSPTRKSTITMRVVYINTNPFVSVASCVLMHCELLLTVLQCSACWHV